MCSNKKGDEKASHIVSAWSKEDGFCLGQKAVEEKSNEITAIPEKIKKKRADYLLALKRNQNSMYEDVQEYLMNEEFQKELQKKGNYKKTQEKAHGQIEIREY